MIKLLVVVVILALGSHPSSKVNGLRMFQPGRQLVNEDMPVNLAKRGAKGLCHATGDPHYKSFDHKVFSFMGSCRYTMVTDYCTHGKKHMGLFKVVAENKMCGPSVSCIDSVDVYIGSEKIHLSYLSFSPAPMETPLFSVRRIGGLVEVETKPAVLKIHWNRVHGIFIYLDDSYRGKVCGLCGNFDGNIYNDFMMSNGQVTSSMNQFADSWQSGGKCSSKSVSPKHPCEDNPSRHKEALKDCAVIKSEYFKDCRGAVDLNNLYNDCMYDVCAGTVSQMKDASCEAIRSASELCYDKGKTVSWGHLEQKCSCQRKAKIRESGKIECCHFPFVYNGVTYYGCKTLLSISSKPQCSTEKVATYGNTGECI